MLKIKECKKFMKKCNKCEQVKLLSHFKKQKRNRDGRDGTCKQCEYTRYTHICERCGKEFKSGQKHQQYCSRECSPALIKGEENANYRSVDYSCDYCGKIFKIQKYETTRGIKHYCCGECQHKAKSESMIGEGSPNWNPNLTPEEREGQRKEEGYQKWVKDIYKKYNYTCQKCLKRGKGLKLNAHHIKNYKNNKEIRVDIDNGICLCEDCHKEFHKKYGRNNNNEKQLKEFLEKE